MAVNNQQALCCQARRVAQELTRKDARRVVFLHEGIAGMNYRVETEDGALVVRFDLRRHAQEVRDDSAFALRARENGVETPADLMGVVEIHGSTASVRPFVAGSAVPETQEALSRIGGTLAAIHDGCVEHLPERRSFYSFLDDRSDGVWDRLGEARQIGWSRLYSAPLGNRILDLLARRGEGEQARIGIAHGDFKEENLIWHGPDNGVCVLDWEKAHVGDVGFDLGLALFHVLRKSKSPDNHLRAFLSGYLSRAPLSLEGVRLGLLTELAGLAWFARDLVFLQEAMTRNDEEFARRREYFRLNGEASWSAWLSELRAVETAVDGAVCDGTAQ